MDIVKYSNIDPKQQLIRNWFTRDRFDQKRTFSTILIARG